MKSYPFSNPVTKPGAEAGSPADRIDPRVDGGTLPVWKRALDVGSIICSLPIVIPLAVLIVIVSKMVSRGPVLFKQERVGLQGRRFMCFKFRSMVVGADSAVHAGHLNHLIDSGLPMVKMDAAGDARLIPFGSLLRASGLDELPQLLNVLRGEMTLVGPRPCVPFEYAKYLPWQKGRFETEPGLTGLWQVSGKNRTTFNEMIRLDIDYARRKSLWLDLKIIAKTIPAMAVQMLESRRQGKPISQRDSVGEVRPGQQA